MKIKMSRISCGVATASLFAIALSACGDDSSNSPDYNETNSSAIEQTDLSSAGNDDILSSSDVPPTSSNSAPKSSDAKPASSSVSPTSSSDTPTSSEAVPESSSEFNAKNNCLPGGDCDGDGIPDGIYRPDLEPCTVEDSTMEFYSRIFTCKEGKWVYTPDADDTDPHREVATDAKAEHNNGPAVAPSVVKVKNADGTVTFRDDGADIYDFNSVTVGAELFGDTLVAHVEFSDPTRSSFVMGTLTFTVSNAFADINYLKYDFRGNVKPVREVEELLPCGSNASCEQCPPDNDCGGVAW